MVRSTFYRVDVDAHQTINDCTDDGKGDLGILLPYASSTGEVHDLRIGRIGNSVLIEDLRVVRLWLNLILRLILHSLKQCSNSTLRLCSIVDDSPVDEIGIGHAFEFMVLINEAIEIGSRGIPPSCIYKELDFGCAPLIRLCSFLVPAKLLDRRIGLISCVLGGEQIDADPDIRPALLIAWITPKVRWPIHLICSAHDAI